MATKTTARDMTSGNILKQLVLFALPLLLGNVFQLLYGTVDTLVVGNYVGKEALAAVGSTTMIINMVVFFFNGLSIGAGVVISNRFGAKDLKNLHVAIETTMAMTIIMSIFFTVAGVLMVDPMLTFVATPADVRPDAAIYLRWYMAGVSGILLYNMGSGILRAVGDTKRPLYFLILTSVINIILDLAFVLIFNMGITGVALATVIAQFISAFMVLFLLIRTDDIYKLTLRDLGIDLPTLKRILAIGLPTGLQSMITAFSNVFVQSYINVFGSTVMAGWNCYNKLDQFVMLPMDSMAKSLTTFVGQNYGAQKTDRVGKGTTIAISMTLLITGTIVALMYIFAVPLNGIFSKDVDVVAAAALFIRVNVPFILFNCVNHTLAGSLRGRGDSFGPVVIMLSCFVATRQLYLFVMTHFIANTPTTVGFGYPVGWTSCCIVEVTYYYLRWVRKGHKVAQKNV